LTPGLAVLGLLAVSCVAAPIVYHDGLPVSMPAPGFAAVRVEYNRAYRRHDSIAQEPTEYFGGVLLYEARPESTCPGPLSEVRIPGAGAGGRLYPGPRQTEQVAWVALVPGFRSR
jgi:hypothetical protein